MNVEDLGQTCLERRPDGVQVVRVESRALRVVYVIAVPSNPRFTHLLLLDSGLPFQLIARDHLGELTPFRDLSAWADYLAAELRRLGEVLPEEFLDAEVPP